MGLKVQGATQNTSPVLPERRIIFGTSCSMIEAALEREANLPPKLRKHARFERVICLAASAPTVVRVARGERERESKRKKILIPRGTVRAESPSHLLLPQTPMMALH